MARTFVHANADRIQWDMRDTADTMAGASGAMMLYFDVAAMSTYNNDLLNMNTSGGSWRAGNYTNSYTNALYTTAESKGSSSAGVGAYPEVAMWIMMGYTKAAGTVTPRFHMYRFNNAGDPNPTHVAGDATHGNITAVGAGGYWQFGAFQSNVSSAFGGELAAFAYWKRALSDGEFDRLVRGNWDLLNPDFHREFPSGKDRPLLAASDLSRGRTRQIAEFGTTRGIRRDPPGFRFSINNRRR